jgi:hypothetical protein
MPSEDYPPRIGSWSDSGPRLQLLKPGQRGEPITVNSVKRNAAVDLVQKCAIVVP